MSDPLSLFAGDDSSSSEEEETTQDNFAEQDSETLSSVDKLPSPSTLFSTVGKPSFLNEPVGKEIDWDHFVKNKLDDDKYSVHITEDGSYAAIPPPSQDSDNRVYNSLSAAIVGTYNKGAVGQIAGAPVPYSGNSTREVVTSEDNACTEETRGVKRGAAEEQGSASGSNSKKSKTFRLKEKRKRDLGQSSRGKNYVEEEKRLLRQQFGTDSVMS